MIDRNQGSQKLHLEQEGVERGHPAVASRDPIDRWTSRANITLDELLLLHGNNQRNHERGIILPNTFSFASAHETKTNFPEHIGEIK